MDSRTGHRLLTLLVAAGAMSSAPVVRAQSPDSLPPGVTPAAVEKGRKIYGGPGLCFACHGPEGKGGIGPDLTDRAWLHHDGDYQTLVKQITDGITVAQSKGGQIMPPRGGSVINDAEVLAVAAYVWTLSRRASSSP